MAVTTVFNMKKRKEKKKNDKTTISHMDNLAAAYFLERFDIEYAFCH